MQVPESDKEENQFTFQGFLVLLFIWLFIVSANCAAIWFMK